MDSPSQEYGKTMIACDQCLRTAARCRFNPAKEDECKGCQVRGLECTWTRAPKPLPPPDSRYIQYLEERVKEVEKHLKSMFPGINTKRELDTLLDPHTLPTGGKSNPTITNQERHGSPNATTPSPIRKPLPPSTIVASTPGTARLIQQVRLANLSSGHVRVDKHDEDIVWNGSSSKRDVSSYHGFSSLEVLSRDAGVMRNGYCADSILSTIPTAHRRPKFWQLTPPEIRHVKRCLWNSEEGLALELPPDDLIPDLLDAFFNVVFFPIIHRGMFEKQLKEGLHKRDGTFLRVFLLVCANGARWCNDPRVLDERWPVPLSAGHRWFRQFDPSRKSLIEQIALEDAQLMTLIAIYSFGTSAIYNTWNVIGVGIRLMQDVGAHRKRSTQSLEDELFKRCFWTMVILDRLLCLTMDRHALAQDLDSDLDHVLEVDDEMWSLEPGAPPPVQPVGVPSILSCFNQMIKLGRIAGRCLQTVYALESTKRLIGLDGPQGAEWMFNDINSMFSSWVRDVPSFLRLPNTDSYRHTRFFTNVVELWALYYDLLIAANRPFIAKTSSPLAAPALKICHDGARECAKILVTYLRVPESIMTPGMLYPAFSSAMILAIDLIAEGKSSDLASIDRKEEDLRECMNVLKLAENTFHLAGRLHDMVREFEESWRLELSPRARSGAASSPASENSVLSKAKIKVEDDTTFDLTLPPDTIAMTQTSPPISHLPQVTEPAPSYEYAHPNAYADEMFAGLDPFAALHRLAGPGKAPSGSQTQSEAPLSSISATEPKLQPYLPDYGYNCVNAMQRHAERSASISHLPPDRVSEGDLNALSAAIPGLGVFSPSGWMSGSSQAGWASEPQQSRGSLEGTGFPATHWNATMHGTLGLHGRHHNPQARSR
ncbi:hypothetical protein OPQ81_008973 [Rhizoctonia solani]|nr:hypothetical protein OPQ81_008973 [Rhizoctonia solani]